MLASDPCESYFHQNMFVVQGITDLWSGIAWTPCRLRGTFRLGRQYGPVSGQLHAEIILPCLFFLPEKQQNKSELKSVL